MAAPQGPFYRELGARLTRARRAARITQADLARTVGLSRTSITNIEKGRQPVQVHVLLALADALTVSPIELLPSSLEAPPAPNSKLRVLDTDKRAWAERIMKPVLPAGPTEEVNGHGC